MRHKRGHNMNNTILDTLATAVLKEVFSNPGDTEDEIIDHISTSDVSLSHPSVVGAVHNYITIYSAFGLIEPLSSLEMPIRFGITPRGIEYYRQLERAVPLLPI